MGIGLLIAGIAVVAAAAAVYLALRNAKDDANSNFSSSPVGCTTTSCPPSTRKGSEAFKRDSNGDIIATKTGGPYGVQHGGAPGETFVVEEYELELQDGSTVKATKSLGKLDPATGSLIPDNRMDTDCHGVTFADGEYWINNDQVDKVLSGSSYTQTSSPKQGDVGVFRDSSGNVVHSVTVSGVDSNGNVTSVTGLGGLETTEHTDAPADAWSDPNATIDYYTK
jgi:hypothetical protein